MKVKNYINTFLLSLFVVSCGEYGKLLESNDYEKQYQAALDYYKEGKTTKAITLFSNIMNVYDGTERIDTIKFYFANSLFDRGDFLSSGEMFDDFRKNYTRSPFIEKAEYMYAMSFYYDTPNSELDQTNAVNAKGAFEEYLYRYPNSENAEKVRSYILELVERMHKKDFYVGETYYKIGYHNSAITTLKNILKRAPDTPMREEILFMILKSNYAYAKESVADKQRERFYNVIDAYYSLTSQFPESQYSRMAERLFRNAEAITQGQATISDYSSDVVLLHDKIYKRKDILEEKILDENKKGEKANQKKLEKLIKELEEVNTEIERIESGEEVQTSEESAPENNQNTQE